jgi:hypothetical protein
MKIRSPLFLAIVVLATAAGCASVTGPTALDGGQAYGLASPAQTIPDCRNQGSYNRAANLCVSNGP